MEFYISTVQATYIARPLLQSYPITDKDGCKRSFRAVWFEQYNWLEYSVTENRAFCFACRHFGVVGHNSEIAYTTTGFQNWKKAHAKTGFPQHNRCDSHVEAMVAWVAFKSIKQSGAYSVRAMVDEQYLKQV